MAEQLRVLITLIEDASSVPKHPHWVTKSAFNSQLQENTLQAPAFMCTHPNIDTYTYK